MLDSSACKRFTAALDNVLDNQEDTDLAAAGERCELARAGGRCFILRCKLHICFFPHSLRTQADDDDIPEELLLGKQQLSELASDSAKVKAMGIFKTVK